MIEDSLNNSMQIYYIVIITSNLLKGGQAP